MINIKNEKKVFNNNQKVLIAMSGGVDSSVAAWLLKKKNYQVTGIFLNLGQSKYKESLTAARKVASKISINFKIIDFKRQFKKEVINYFLRSYYRGLTPNPCIVCNQKIKFTELLKLAKKYRADFIATGHYARIIPPVIARIRRRGGDLPCRQAGEVISKYFAERDCRALLCEARNDASHLLVAEDESKDQSYFLYTLKQKQLAKVLFPLGDYTKARVREIAQKNHLSYFKKESQDICFLPAGTFQFLKKNLKLTPGQIINAQGRVLGRHEGLALYTLGQRRAVRIGGIGPFYVARKDKRKNQLLVTNKADDSVLYSDKLLVKRINWLSGKNPKMPLQCQARIRYQQSLVDCLVSEKKENYLIKFTRPLRAIVPGQSVVFYHGKEVLGGGVIK